MCTYRFQSANSIAQQPIKHFNVAELRIYPRPQHCGAFLAAVEILGGGDSVPPVVTNRHPPPAAASDKAAPTPAPAFWAILKGGGASAKKKDDVAAAGEEEDGEQLRRMTMRKSRSVAVTSADAGRSSWKGSGGGRGWHFPSPMKVFRQSKSSARGGGGLIFGSDGYNPEHGYKSREDSNCNPFQIRLFFLFPP